MKNHLAVRLGSWGAALGMLAGIVELSIGSRILPWIGNKEAPFILGCVTLALSGLAWISIRMARRQEPITPNRRLAILLGVLVPAGVCFTTVGRLWYLPGTLLLGATLLLRAEYWRDRPRESTQPWRWVSAFGALVNLLSFGAAFWLDAFGLFREMTPVGSDRLLIEILPMDILRRTVYAFGTTRVEKFESGPVMAVYLLLVLGAGISLLAVLAASRLFTRIGGGISLAGVMVFIWQLPAILLQANYQIASPFYRSSGWGGYLALLGTVLILLGAFVNNSKPGDRK